jgi:hypothetical protein
MTDYDDLIQRLEAHGAVFNRDNVALDAAYAIKELVDERDKLVRVICEHVAKRKEYFDRAEKAEADLAAAREALERIKSVARNPTTNERLAACWKIANEAAIAAARAEGGE